MHCCLLVNVKCHHFLFMHPEVTWAGFVVELSFDCRINWVALFLVLVFNIRLNVINFILGRNWVINLVETSMKGFGASNKYVRTAHALN